MTVTAVLSAASPVAQDHLMFFFFKKELIFNPQAWNVQGRPTYRCVIVKHLIQRSILRRPIFVVLLWRPSGCHEMSLYTKPTLLMGDERINPPERTYLPPLFTCVFKFWHSNACFHRKRRRKHRAPFRLNGCFHLFYAGLQPPCRLLDLQHIKLMKRCHWKPAGNCSLASPPVKVYLVIQLLTAP